MAVSPSLATRIHPFAFDDSSARGEICADASTADLEQPLSSISQTIDRFVKAPHRETEN
jgi:hypothetical protein